MNSHLCKECKVFKLDINKRLYKSNIDEQSRNKISEFAQRKLQISDGAISCIERINNDDDDGHWIEIS